MNPPNQNKIVRSVLLSALALALFGPVVAAESVKIEGPIKSRNGDTMIVKSSRSLDVTVQLTESTEVGQVQGVLQARRKQMSMAALKPQKSAGHLASRRQTEVIQIGACA